MMEAGEKISKTMRRFHEPDAPAREERVPSLKRTVRDDPAAHLPRSDLIPQPRVAAAHPGKAGRCPPELARRGCTSRISPLGVEPVPSTGMAGCSPSAESNPCGVENNADAGNSFTVI